MKGNLKYLWSMVLFVGFVGVAMFVVVCGFVEGGLCTFNDDCVVG